MFFPSGNFDLLCSLAFHWLPVNLYLSLCLQPSCVNELNPLLKGKLMEQHIRKNQTSHQTVQDLYHKALVVCLCHSASVWRHVSRGDECLLNCNATLWTDKNISKRHRGLSLNAGCLWSCENRTTWHVKLTWYMCCFFGRSVTLTHQSVRRRFVLCVD